MFQTIPFCRDIHYVILSMCRSDKNIIMSLIDSRGTVFYDNPIFQAFFLLLFTLVENQINLSLEKYFLLVFSLFMSRNMLLFYSHNLGINDKHLKVILWSRNTWCPYIILSTLLTSLSSFFFNIVEIKKPGSKYLLKIC